MSLFSLLEWEVYSVPLYIREIQLFLFFLWVLIAKKLPWVSKETFDFWIILRLLKIMEAFEARLNAFCIMRWLWADEEKEQNVGVLMWKTPIGPCTLTFHFQLGVSFGKVKSLEGRASLEEEVTGRNLKSLKPAPLSVYPLLPDCGGSVTSCFMFLPSNLPWHGELQTVNQHKSCCPYVVPYQVFRHRNRKSNWHIAWPCCAWSREWPTVSMLLVLNE